jgi:uncharacterized protein YyaL (SSP411 family)
VDHFGIYAGTYGIALQMFSAPHTQVIVVGDDWAGFELASAALMPFSLNKSVVHMKFGSAVAQNLPPGLAETIPHVPGVDGTKSLAILCSGFACQPPVYTVADLVKAMKSAQ